MFTTVNHFQTSRISFTNSLRQCKPSLVVKLSCQVLLKMHSDELVLKRHGHSYFCAWPYWICICRSFTFRHKIYRRTEFKWIMQRNLLTFAHIKLLAFAPLFNAPKRWQKGKDFCAYFYMFFTRINLFECQNTLSEHIACQDKLFLICFRK